MITFNPAQLGGYASAMKAANPNLKLYVYLNGTFLYKRLYGTVDSSMLSRDAHGTWIASHGYGNYLADPGDPTGVLLRAAGVREAAVRNGLRRLLPGHAGHGAAVARLHHRPTHQPGHGQVWTQLDWLNATSALAAKVASFTGKPVLGNGIGNGPRYFVPARPASCC
jgi:hypothetical protein